MEHLSNAWSGQGCGRDDDGDLSSGSRLRIAAIGRRDDLRGRIGFNSGSEQRDRRADGVARVRGCGMHVCAGPTGPCALEVLSALNPWFPVLSSQNKSFKNEQLRWLWY